MTLEEAIEALKRLKEHREDHIDITFRALPSETFEQEEVRDNEETM